MVEQARDIVPSQVGEVNSSLGNISLIKAILGLLPAHIKLTKAEFNRFESVLDEQRESRQRIEKAGEVHHLY